VKRVLTLGGLLLSVLAVYAAVPKSAATALKEIRKRYREAVTFQATFKESFQWQLTGETVDRQGTIVLSGDNRFRIETPEQVIVADGQNLYRYNLLRKQVMIEPVSKAEGLLPNKMLLKFAEEFDAVSLAPLLVEGGEGYRLDLQPQDKEKALLSEVTLWATTTPIAVRRIKLIDLNGNSTTYFLRDIRFDQPVDTTMLHFSPPQGVEIFDLR